MEATPGTHSIGYPPIEQGCSPKPRQQFVPLTELACKCHSYKGSFFKEGHQRRSPCTSSYLSTYLYRKLLCTCIVLNHSESCGEPLLETSSTDRCICGIFPTNLEVVPMASYLVAIHTSPSKVVSLFIKKNLRDERNAACSGRETMVHCLLTSRNTLPLRSQCSITLIFQLMDYHRPGPGPTYWKTTD